MAREQCDCDECTGEWSPEAEEEEMDLMMCSMGRDGQCGQAGSEWCDFECPIMRGARAEARAKANQK